MKRTAFIIWVILIILTLFSTLTSNFTKEHAASIILILAAIKFTGVSFYFMELKKAHVFWKSIVLSCLFIFVALILVLK